MAIIAKNKSLTGARVAVVVAVLILSGRSEASICMSVEGDMYHSVNIATEELCNAYTSKYSVAIGDDSWTAESSIAVGKMARATAEESVAFGRNASSSAANSVAVGAHSQAGRAALNQAKTSPEADAAKNEVYAAAVANVDDKNAVLATVVGDLGAVAVGAQDKKRQIINVAAGSADSDAVNVAQLKAVANIAVNNHQAIQQLDDRISELDRDLQAGIAGATAVAGLQRPNLPGKSIMSVAAAGYRGAKALAVGYAHNSDNDKYSVKVGLGINSRRDINWVSSLGYQW